MEPRTGLRVPQCWNDRALLEDEPFHHWFATRLLVGEGRHGVSALEWNKDIVDEVTKASSGLEAAQAWLDIAFYASEDETAKIRDTKVTTDEKALELFVKVYWLIFQNDERAALILLNKERRERDYWWDFGAGVRAKKHQKTRRTKHRPAIDQVAEVGAGHEDDNVDVPSVDADADTSSAYHSSVFDEISDEEKGDISISSDTAAVTSIMSSPGPSAVAKEGPALSAQDVDDEATRSGSVSGLRGRKRVATAEENYSSGHSSPMDISDEDMAPIDLAKGSHLSAPPPSVSSGKSSISDARVPAEPNFVTTVHNSDAFPVPAPKTRSQTRASNPSESPNSLRATSRAKTEQIPVHKLKKSPRKKARPTDDASSDSDYVASSKAPPNTPHRATRSKSMKENKPKQAGSRRSTKPHPAESSNKTRGNHTRRQSVRLAVADSLLDAPSTTVRTAPGQLDEAGSKPPPKRRGRPPKAVTAANFKTSKPVRRSTRTSELPTRPQRRRRTGANEELHIAMDNLTKATKDSTAGQHNQGTAKIQSSPANKILARPSPDKLTPPRAYNDKEGSPSGVRTNEPLSEVERSQEISKSFAVPATILGKRKEWADGPDSQTPLVRLSTVAQSELQGIMSRPVAKLPAEHRVRSSQRQITPLPKQTVSVDNPVHDPDLKAADQVVRDAASLALRFMKDPPKPLPDWTNDDNTDDQGLDSVREPHFEDEHGNEEDLSPEIVTIRDHEPDSRPRLPKNPPMWAQSRQEVCESFGWFRSYQGGVYFANDIVKGYLLGAFASSRDLFHHNGRLIISHGGGKSESIHVRDGRMETQMAEDQLAQDKSVRALLRNYTEKRPLVLLADDRYKLFPYNLAATGCAYVVLGFYCITHAWAESHSASNERGRVVRYKFAFQWCESQGEPWWIKQSGVDVGLRGGDNMVRQLDAAASSVDTSVATVPPSRSAPVKIAAVVPADQTSIAPQGIYSKCGHCKVQVPQVYNQGWMCLTPECTAFWTMNHGGPPSGALDYTAEFLELKPIHSLPANLPELFPKPPPTEVWDDITTTYAFSKGWHCPQCGRLSSRYKWVHWECANCGNRVITRGRLRGPKEFWTQLDHCTNHRLGYDSGIIKPRSELYSVGGAKGEYIMYILPFHRGKIHLIRGNPRTNQEADSIFQQYQIQAASGAIPFRRFPLRAHKCRGTLLTNYFSQNSGEPYQYVGGTDNTVPFKDAASAVLQALELIQTRAQAALKKIPKFNEILSAAYMERQKMAFHSDSERGLGPVVASLSLGSAAAMHFRVHAHLRQEGEGRENALSLTLRHGDVLVMEGAGVQECYEHTVIPCNFRVAATARWIGGA